MSVEVIGLWLGIAGFLLSFISAYAQIKGFLLRVFRVSTTAAKRWADRDRATTELYLKYPSSFGAYLASRFVLFVICMLMIVVLRPLAPWAAVIHPWLGDLVKLGAPAVAGLILGAISANCSSVLKLARERSGS